MGRKIEQLRPFVGRSIGIEDRRHAGFAGEAKEMGRAGLPAGIAEDRVDAGREPRRQVRGRTWKLGIGMRDDDPLAGAVDENRRERRRPACDPADAGAIDAFGRKAGDDLIPSGIVAERAEQARLAAEAGDRNGAIGRGAPAGDDKISGPVLLRALRHRLQ